VENSEGKGTSEITKSSWVESINMYSVNYLKHADCLAYSSTVKAGVTYFSEITGDFKRISLLYIPVNTAVQDQICQATNLIFCTNRSNTEVRTSDCDLKLHYYEDSWFERVYTVCVVVGRTLVK
jgi:hypothetical protein